MGSAENRIGGVALIVGSVMVVVTFLLTPGGLVIDPVELADLVGLSGVIYTLSFTAAIIWFIMLGAGLFRGLPELSPDSTHN